MYKPNPGQIEYHRACIKDNIRIDGRQNNQQREVTVKSGILKQANGSCYMEVFDSSASLYVGIKAEIIDIQKNKQEECLEIKIESMKRRDAYQSQSQQKENQFSDSQQLKYLESQIQNKLLKFVNKQPLVVVKDKKMIKLNIDVFLIDYVHFGYLDLIVKGIRKALEDLKIPEIKITHNQLTNEDEIDLLEDQLNQWSISENGFEIPHLFTIGEVDNHMVVDLTLEEYYSVQNKYLVTVKENGSILQIEKSGLGHLAPENILKLTNFAQKQAKILTEEYLQEQEQIKMEEEENKQKLNEN